MCPPSRSTNTNRVPSEIKSWAEEPWKVKEAFIVLDKDADGKIDISDLEDFFTRSCFSVGNGLSRQEMEAMISIADADNSGSVDFQEFQRILGLIMPEIEEINESRSNSDDCQMWALKEAFSVMDRDGDGIVTAEDLNSFFSSSVAGGGGSSESCNALMSEDDLADMVEAAGGTAKSGVCYQDFVRLMMTMMKGFS